MNASTITRRRRWRSGVPLAAALGALLVCAAPSPAAITNFCPSSGYMTLASAEGCTDTTREQLFFVSYFNPNLPFHCAVGKAGPQQDGSSSNVFPAVCSYGLPGSGEVTASGGRLGTWGYARGKNTDPSGWTFTGFRGEKEH